MSRRRACAPKGYLTSDQACACIGISKPTLGRWRDAGKLTASDYQGNVVYRESEVIKIAREWAAPQERVRTG
jgi:predicted site-specific integrase-resolvase